MKTLKSIAKNTIIDYIDPMEPISYGWPPSCTALLYQPERPAAVKRVPTEETPSLKEE